MTEDFQKLTLRSKLAWDLLSQKPWIRVGTGLFGEASGSLQIIDEVYTAIKTNALEATVSEVGTSGLCYAEPLLDIQIPNRGRVIYGNVDPSNVEYIIKEHLAKGSPPKKFALATIDCHLEGIPKFKDLPMMKGQIRIALRNAGEIEPGDIDQYIANNGFVGLDRALSEMDPSEVLGIIKSSGLRGRGGAAFSTGTKWGFLAGNTAPKKYILCNGEEGDPGAFNDKAILETDPLSLIEGCILAGYATNATNGVVFIRHGHDAPIDRTNKAIDACYADGLLGKNILGSEFSFDMEIVLVGESYVAGEETALMEAVEGKRSMPRFRPPFPAAYGVWGFPSNINNIKTISYAPEIVRNGPEWFSSIGTDKSKGTAIACLSGHIKFSGLVEVPFGTSIRKIVEQMGGGDPNSKSIKFLQTGGPLGGVLTNDQFDMLLDFDEMAAAGAMFGSGGLIVCNQETSSVDLTRVLIAFDQMESCGKCFPCRLGTSHLLDILDRACLGKSLSGDLQLMERVGQNMKVGSLCGHGQLGYNPVASALKAFSSEFNQQMFGEGDIEIKKFVAPLHTRRGSQTLGETPTSIVKEDFTFEPKLEASQ